MKAGKWILILMSIWGLALLNRLIPYVRFTNELNNSVFGIFVAILPIVCFLFTFFLKKTSTRILNITFFSIFSIISSVYIFFALLFIPDSRVDLTFQKIHEVGKGIVVYRTDGGATTSYGIVIRQEKNILPGIIAVKYLFDKYRQYDVNCTIKADTLIIKDSDSKEILSKIEL